jgi:hypothetical protein
MSISKSMWCRVLLKIHMLSHLVLWKVKHTEHMLSKAKAFNHGHNQRCIEIPHDDPLLFSVAQGIFWLSSERLSRSTLHLIEGERWVCTLLCSLTQCCGTVTIYYGSGSGSDFWKVMVPVPVPVLTFEKWWFRFRFRYLLSKKLRFRFRFQLHT